MVLNLKKPVGKNIKKLRVPFAFYFAYSNLLPFQFMCKGNYQIFG